jgi:hypothetical protein
MKGDSYVSQPQDAVPLPPRPNLEQYKKLAKDLVKVCKPGRTRPPAGHNSAPSRGLAAARPTGHLCQCGRADALSPSGLDSKLGTLTTWAIVVTVR